MFSLSLILFLLVLILLLLKKVSIRIIYSDEIKIQFDYYPILLEFSTFGKKKKKSGIRFRHLLKRIYRLLSASKVRVGALPPKIDENKANLTQGIYYSFIFPTLAYMSTRTKELSIDKKQTNDKNTLDISFDVRLYLIIKQLLLLVFDIAKENLGGKHA